MDEGAKWQEAAQEGMRLEEGMQLEAKWQEAAQVLVLVQWALEALTLDPIPQQERGP